MNLSDSIGSHNENSCNPKNIKSTELSCEPFPFVRVDFYERNGEPILGELTFTPYFGMANYYSKEGCLWLGEKIALPEPYGKHFE